MTKSQRARELFSQNFNCAQSVFAVFAEDYGLDNETALKLTSGLGGGLRMGEACGAANGGAMVVGLKFGQAASGDMEAKLLCYAKAEEFMVRFKEKNGSVVCRELLGCAPNTPEGREYMKEHGLVKKICAELVAGAVEILEELGY